MAHQDLSTFCSAASCFVNKQSCVTCLAVCRLLLSHSHPKSFIWRGSSFLRHSVSGVVKSCTVSHHYYILELMSLNNTLLLQWWSQSKNIADRNSASRCFKSCLFAACLALSSSLPVHWLLTCGPLIIQRTHLAAATRCHGADCLTASGPLPVYLPHR